MMVKKRSKEPTSSTDLTQLSRREREIMSIVYRRGEATAMEVREAMPQPPSYSAVRALLKVLEDKKHLIHKEDGPRYVFIPTKPRESVAKSALKQVLSTFFGGSVSSAFATILSDEEIYLSDKERSELRQMIAEATQEETR